jgi:hypothetical protein
MTNTIQVFDYDVLLGTTSHASPRIVICLQRWSEVGEKENRKITISAHLMTEREIDHHIKELKADLEEVRIKAKQALRAGSVSDGTKN